MEKRSKTRIIFMAIFAILAIFDMISTYLAASLPGVREINSIGAILIGSGWGLGGYVLFYIYLLSMAGIVLGIIEVIFYINEKYLNIKFLAREHSLIYIYISIVASILQITTIIGNIGLVIK